MKHKKVFISHSPADHDVAYQLGFAVRALLRDPSATVETSDSAGNLLSAVLDTANLYIVVLTSDYMDDTWSNFELGVILARLSAGRADVVPVVGDVSSQRIPRMLREQRPLGILPIEHAPKIPPKLRPIVYAEAQTGA